MPRKPAKAKPFATEAALCAAFIADATRDGKWTAYAETGGFDILLVRPKDGLQIGIQAKLVLNARVLEQSLPDWYSHGTTGPDCRAVLVPDGCGGGLSTVCDYLGLTVIQQRAPSSRSPHATRFRPELPARPNDWDYWAMKRWHQWCPNNRIKLPEYVPDVAAGAAAPLQLTDWKIKAIKLAVLLEHRPVQRSDFRSLGISPTRWTDRHHGWLRATPVGYVATPHMPKFAREHPVNYRQIKADVGVWGKDLLREQGTGRLL